MASYGEIISYTYTSSERLPIEGVVVTITKKGDDGESELIRVQRSNSSGRTQSVQIATPDIADSQTPGPAIPFETVTITADYPGYERIQVDDVQVFPDTVTIQNFQMIPLSLYADDQNRTEFFLVPPQNL